MAIGGNHAFATFFCERCDYEFRAQIDCGDRLCVECNRNRRNRIMRRFVPLVKKMAAPKFLTLTLKRRALCRANVRFLRQCFTRLRHRDNRKWNKKHPGRQLRFTWLATSGVYQIEIGTVDDLGQANLHIHAVIDSPWMSQASLSKVWHEITGDSYIVDIRQAKDARDLVHYMSKHLGKMPNEQYSNLSYTSTWKHDLINDVLKGTRLVQGFGTLAHVSMSLEGATCPKCGSAEGFTLLAPWEPCHQGI